jgi:hypothetical protein
MLQSNQTNNNHQQMFLQTPTVNGFCIRGRKLFDNMVSVKLPKDENILDIMFPPAIDIEHPEDY